MFQNENVQMTELTEDELTTVAGGDFGSFGGCGFGCGGFIGGCGTCGFSTGPFITAFTNYNASTFAATSSVAFSNVNQTSFFSQFN